MRLASSNRPARLAAALAGAVLGASLAVTTPVAHAEDQTDTDIRTDVREADSDGTDRVRKRRDRARDIVWSKASYADNKFKLLIEVRELASQDHIFVWQLKDDTQRWSVSYNHEGANPVLSLSVFGGSEAPCEGLTSERFPGQERVKVVMPASCIGHPEWVKYGAGAVHSVSKGRFRIDDGRRAHEFDTLHLALGGRIHEN